MVVSGCVVAFWVNCSRFNQEKPIVSQMFRNICRKPKHNHGKPKSVTDCCCGFFVSLADGLSLWPGTHSHSHCRKSCDHICFWITVSVWVLFPRCTPVPALQDTTHTSPENQLTCPISSAVRHYPSAQDPGLKPELLYFESVSFPLWIDVAQHS